MLVDRGQIHFLKGCTVFCYMDIHALLTAAFLMGNVDCFHFLGCSKTPSKKHFCAQLFEHIRVLL